MNSLHTTQNEMTQADLDSCFSKLKANQFKIAETTARERKEKLKRLNSVFLQHRNDLKEALEADLGKPPFEVDLVEIFTVTSEIKHALRNLKKWTSRHRVSTPIAFLGSRSYIQYEPKGVVLIMSPWNFPVTLTIAPLVAAIAAGNTVVIKPSEKTPHTTVVLGEIIKQTFSDDEVIMIVGGIPTAQRLLTLPFNHIYFTGSSQTGKIVMEAAAKHLASVTLELGGKSPAIVDETADLKLAAKRILWSKCTNSGQICIAPDHIFVHEQILKPFLEALRNQLSKFYEENDPEQPVQSRLIDSSHFNKIANLLSEGKEGGAHVEMGGSLRPEDNFIETTILTNVPDDSRMMQEEIFGPLLPVQTYNDIDVLITKLQQKEKPLALYIYSRNRKNIQKLLRGTRAGGSCINHSGTQYYNNNLPFGGSNFSGIGKGHGWFGFQAFSNARGIYEQILPGPLELLAPPYNNIKQKILDLAIKFL
ncbi:MAG: aldehyde dehydrogenase family protein [Saprospiraceae bacterium]|nr:aldehyde dehydrogenase family protein [Saprospiraceae bacterium]